MSSGQSFGNYILDEAGEPVEVSDFMTWAAWMYEHKGEFQLGLDYVGRRVVSTVYFGLDIDAALSGRPPRLWETMVFAHKGDPHTTPDREALNQFTRRHTSRIDALIGHATTVDLVRILYPPDLLD